MKILQNPLFLPLYIPTTILAICRGLLILILPLYASSFEVSYGLIGVALAAEGIGTLIGDVPAGILIGRMGQKRIMTVSLICVAFSILALSWAQGISEIILYRLIAGIGGALWNISRMAYIADTVSNEKRGRSIALFGGLTRIGIFAGPLVGGAIGAAFGLRTALFVCALIAATGIIFPFLFTKENASPVANVPHGLKGHGAQLLDILKAHYQILAKAGLGQLCAQGIRAGRSAIVPLFAADVLLLDVNAIGSIISFSSGIDMLLFPVAGFVMDRYGRKYAYVPSFLIQAIGMVLIPFTTGYFGLLAATLIIGFGNGLSSGTMMTLGTDLAPKESMGEFIGLWRLIGDVGHSGAPIIVGNIAAVLSLSASAFVIAGIGLSAALILGLFVPETLKVKQRSVVN